MTARETYVKLSLTPHEKAKLQSAADSVSVPLAVWVRSLALEAANKTGEAS